MTPVHHIGIIGGVGPEATCILYQRIVAAHKLQTIGQYPKVSVYSLPVSAGLESNMIKGLMHKDHVSEVCCCLHEGMEMMRRAEADMIALPCNTLTYYARNIFDRPFQNPVDAAVAQAREQGCRRVAVLATAATRSLRLFEEALAPHRILCSYPDEPGQKLIGNYILSNLWAVQAGTVAAQQYEQQVLALVREMARQADTIVLGCTDLFPLQPLIRRMGIPVIDSLEALVEACIQKLDNTVLVKN